MGVVVMVSSILLVELVEVARLQKSNALDTGGNFLYPRMKNMKWWHDFSVP